MGYFDMLSESAFKEDKEGNSIFYQWGMLGRGVIIDSKERRDEISAFISKYYAYSFTLVLVMQLFMLLFQSDILRTTMIFLGLGSIMTIWYVKKIAILTEGLAYSDTKYTMDEILEKTAHQLPKFVIWGGFVMMVLLVFISIATILYLDEMPIWAGVFLLFVSLFAAYSYYRMIVFSKDAKPLEVSNAKSEDSSSEDNSDESIEWNFKNKSIIAVLVSVMIGYVYYVQADSKKEFEERMARYKAMTTPQMAMYLAQRNASPEKIDLITKHTGTKAENNRLYFYREVSSNRFIEFVDVNNLDGEKLKMRKQLKREMCGYPTYDLFYDKGGEVVYVYHQKKEHETIFLFEIVIDKKFCL